MSFEDFLCNAEWEKVGSEWPHMEACNIETRVGGASVFALRNEIKQLCERRGLRYKEVVPRNITPRISLDELFK